MTILSLSEYLTPQARDRLRKFASDKGVIDDGFVSTFTPFSTAVEKISSSRSADAVSEMRSEISKALDRLDEVVADVLKGRKEAEASAYTWIKIGGGVIVLLILAAVVSPFLTDRQVLASITSTLSVSGLLLLLYSPVREMITISNDRSNLILMVHGFRLRFAVANTVEQLQELASELTTALQFTDDIGS